MSKKLVRILKSDTSIAKLRVNCSFDSLDPSILVDEFSAENNQLSFWKYESAEQKKEMIKALKIGRASCRERV